MPVRTSAKSGSGPNTFATADGACSTARWKTICFPSVLQRTPVKMPWGPSPPSMAHRDVLAASSSAWTARRADSDAVRHRAERGPCFDRLPLPCVL